MLIYELILKRLFQSSYQVTGRLSPTASEHKYLSVFRRKLYEIQSYCITKKDTGLRRCPVTTHRVSLRRSGHTGFISAGINQMPPGEALRPHGSIGHPLCTEQSSFVPSACVNRPCSRSRSVLGLFRQPASKSSCSPVLRVILSTDVLE